MIAISADAVKAEDRPLISLKTLFSEKDIQGEKAKFGVVTIPPKVRIPLSGTGSHDQDEYSIVIKGSIVAGHGNQEYRLSAGDASLI